MNLKLISTVIAGCFASQPVFADLAPLPLKVSGRIVGVGFDKGKKGRQVQGKKLQIELASLSQKNFGPLEVACIFYARDLKSGERVMEKRLSLATALSKGGVKVETPVEEFLSSQMHYVGPGTRGRTHGPRGHGPRAGGRVRKVEASGHEYAGWEIRVYAADHTLIGKAYSAAYLDPDKKRS